MAEHVTYKVIHGRPDKLEKQLNELAEHGWRAVSAAHGSTPVVDIVVILEMRSLPHE
jgi:hypothetical protein